MRSPDVSGQAYALTVMTPVKPGEEDALTSYLRALGRDAASPLAQLERTHLGRFVVVRDFTNDRSWGQRREEHLELALLIFTANLDGDLDGYLDELCERLADHAGEIWGRCVGCPPQARGAALKQYLQHNRVETGIFYAAYGHATVAEVRRCLDQREALIELAVEGQRLEPAELQRRFVRAFRETG